MIDPGYLTDHIDLNHRIILFRDIPNLNPEDTGNSEFETNVLLFLKEWLSGQSTFQVRTSGSTGSPKMITLSREQMESSAKATIDFFKLIPGDTVLLCLPVKYIAGKMMIVRCLLGNLKLIAREPSGNLIEDLYSSIRFTAMVPLQLSKILESKTDRDKLDLFKTILIGGGPVDKHLVTKCTHLKPEIYHTYGMTETVTHIAMRKINRIVGDDFYHVMPGIMISTDSRNCLIIKGKVTGGKEITTNDIVELQNKTSFRWLGRIDQVINSGGIKIIPELLEDKISDILAENEFGLRFFITGIPDSILGQKVVMIVEYDGIFKNSEKILRTIKSRLTSYENPKAIYSVYPFQFTESGKIDRNTTTKSINFTIQK